MLALLGTSFTFLMTALGAATVFFFARKVCERAQGALLGFAAGVMMKETKDGAWKVSVRTGARVNATLACSFLGGGGHRAASGCLIEHADYETARAMILNAIAEAVAEEA